jgi:Zn-dependent peptidase ImmA (M78 family)
MSKALWQAIAAREAENLIRELGIASLPVLPIEIAKQLGIHDEAMPSKSSPGVSGMLLRNANQFGILYSTSIDSIGFQNFSVGHEIGHYCLPGHPESVLHDGVHASYAGFHAKDRYELEADHFSAGLLMPTALFDPALKKAGDGLDAVMKLSENCKTSLPATGIRYAQRSPEAAAVIVSRGNEIDYCFMSDTLREIKGIEWIKKGTPLPQSSATKRLNGDAAKVAGSERVDATGALQDWFGGKAKAEIYEEAIGLGSYGRTLTVLTVEEPPDADELEEEEDTEESWTPRFRR